MSNTYEAEFEHRILYEQSAFIEEDKQILTRTYACSYTYPGAISRTTARARLTLVYESTNFGKIIVAGGTIEKWSDKGWITLEEYFDTGSGLETREEIMSHMLNMFKSFILGVSSLDNSAPRPESPPPPPSNPKKKDPKLRILSFKPKVVNDYDKYIKDEENLKDKSEDKKGDDDDSPDFDWI